MLLYAALKFVAYCAWCWFGLRLFAPTRAHWMRALSYGAIRWLLGLAFGLAVALVLGSVSGDAVAALYFGIYVPLRIVEWGIMVALLRNLAPAPPAPGGARIWFWIAGGIAVSFATDLASPEGLAGRFCVGRCLC